MDLFSRTDQQTHPEKIQQIKQWIYDVLEINEKISVSLSQLRCTEPGCPPIETVIAILDKPQRQYKIHKPIAELEQIDIHNLLEKS